MVEGRRGELTVLVDGRVVARKWLFLKPKAERVLAAVRESTSASPGQGHG
jgi:hypothetical protein